MSIVRFVLVLFIIVQLNAQGMNDWQTISYMNGVTDMLILDDDIWVTTTGGVYQFDPEDSTYLSYTNIDGLGSLNLSTIEKDIYNHILVGSVDGNISRYDRNFDLWINFNNLSGVEIVDLYTIEDTLWVGTNSGVAVFLITPDNLEFRDYYNNLPISPEIGYRIAVFNQQIFYATENGLLYAPADFIKNNLKNADSWKVLTETDGLPSNSIRDLARTADSMLIGTADGAAVINTDNDISTIDSWTNGIVRKILVSQNDLYFIRYDDYYKWIGDRWSRINRENFRINAGVIDKDKEVWLGLSGGGITNEGWENSFLIDGPASNHVGIVTKDSKGTLWITSGKFKLYNGSGFYKYDFNQWTNYRYYDSYWSRKNNMVYVYADRTDKIWMGAWGGAITVIDEDILDYYHAWPGDGRIKITTTGGEEEIMLPELSPDQRSCLSTAPVGTEYYTVIPYFIEDDEGNLWLANHSASDPEWLTVLPRDEQGNLEMACSDWIYFGSNIGIRPDEGDISAMDFDDFGRLWFGSFGNGILVFDYNRTIDNPNDDQPLIRVNTSSNPTLFSNTVISLKRDLDGVMWIGTAGGLNSFDGQNFHKHIGETGPIENKINQIFVDDFNNKWISTNGGLSILQADKSPWDSDAWIHYTPENSGLPDKIVNSVFVDHLSGETYIGTESGLSIYRGSFSEYKPDLNSVIGGPSPFILYDNASYVLKNLVFGASVKILTINGKLVRLLSDEKGDIEGGRATWDGKDLNSRTAPSGIYVYLVYNEEGITATGKIAVLKP